MNEPRQMTLKQFSKQCSQEIQDKHFPKFEKEARYLGHGVYQWHDIRASDTRDLFLLGIAARQGIYITDK